MTAASQQPSSSSPAHASAPSVDLREVEHYAALAETWWDDGGPFWPLHRLNRLRTSWIAQHVSLGFDRDPCAD
ncbi:MAG: hypothetical protein AAFU65_18705, partial [Pseudomonadota bacterium]